MKHFGIQGQVVNWIAAFLRDRTQAVLVDSVKSDYVPVQSGVPQGSVLGPTLFLLFINDLPNNIQAAVRMFADDMSAYRYVKTAEDAALLQDDLNKMALWEERWDMKFHPEKCSVLSVSRSMHPKLFDYQLHGHTLLHESSSKYLGVTINSDLRWGQHIDNVCCNANKTLGFVKRNLKISSQTIKERAYKALIRPKVEYSATVWDPHTARDINKIEAIQRRSARYCLNRYRDYSSVSDMLIHLDWPSLESRRKAARLTTH